jgi:hypothetical protein
VGKSEGNISLRTHRPNWEDNIKIDIKMGWDGMGWRKLEFIWNRIRRWGSCKCGNETSDYTKCGGNS